MFGDTLRQARAQRGVTLREAENLTRINRNYLGALEDEQFENLPALPYQRGIVRNYAIFLGLDPVRIVSLFEEARGLSPQDPAFVTPLQPVEMPSNFTPNFAIIAFVLVLGAVAFTWFYSVYSGNPNVVSTPAQVFPTVTPMTEDAIFVDQPTATATNGPAATQVPAAIPPTSVPAVPTVAAEPVASEIVQQPTVEPAIKAQPAVNAGDAVASIMIAALDEIYVQVVVDGSLVWEGTLLPGEVSDWFTGSKFSVYTSSGANTQFTNDRNEVFMMGEEPGEIVYELTAGQ